MNCWFEISDDGSFVLGSRSRALGTKHKAGVYHHSGTDIVFFIDGSRFGSGTIRDGLLRFAGGEWRTSD